MKIEVYFEGKKKASKEKILKYTNDDPYDPKLTKAVIDENKIKANDNNEFEKILFMPYSYIAQQIGNHSAKIEANIKYSKVKPDEEVEFETFDPDKNEGIGASDRALPSVKKNEIELSGNTYTDTSTGIIRELYLNRDHDQSGVEYEITFPQFFGMINPFCNFTLMKSEMEKEGVEVSNRENPVFISAAGVYMKKNGIDLNVFGKYVSPFENERFASPQAGPQPLGDFLNLDMTGGYSFNTKIPVRLYVKVHNLTNRKYSTVIGYPDFGRMMYIGFNLILNHNRKTE